MTYATTISTLCRGGGSKGCLWAAAPIQKYAPTKKSSPRLYFNRRICYCITRIGGAGLSVVNCAPIYLHGPSIGTPILAFLQNRPCTVQWMVYNRFTVCSIHRRQRLTASSCRSKWNKRFHAYDRFPFTFGGMLMKKRPFTTQSHQKSVRFRIYISARTKLPFHALTLLIRRQERHLACKYPVSAIHKDSILEAFRDPASLAVICGKWTGCRQCHFF